MKQTFIGIKPYQIHPLFLFVRKIKAHALRKGVKNINRWVKNM